MYVCMHACIMYIYIYMYVQEVWRASVPGFDVTATLSLYILYIIEVVRKYLWTAACMYVWGLKLRHNLNTTFNCYTAGSSSVVTTLVVVVIIIVPCTSNTTIMVCTPTRKYVSYHVL